MKRKWKYIVYFSCAFDGTVEFHYYSLVNKLDLIHSTSTFSELLMKMTIAGIDLNEVNFNKVSMMQSVEEMLSKNKIPHLKYSENEEPRWITYDE